MGRLGYSLAAFLLTCRLMLTCTVFNSHDLTYTGHPNSPPTQASSCSLVLARTTTGQHHVESRCHRGRLKRYSGFSREGEECSRPRKPER